MAKIKEFVHKSAHGNYLRVRWTAEGLAVTCGLGEEKTDGETWHYAVELCAEHQCCRQAYFLKPAPEWSPELRTER
ncbi:MAG TPA: hypothetical protein VEJ18_00895 [Planctomycetota bacterium]|nr:hypothetical protein [Planctomycetota bacterium]